MDRRTDDCLGIRIVFDDFHSNSAKFLCAAVSARRGGSGLFPRHDPVHEALVSIRSPRPRSGFVHDCESTGGSHLQSDLWLVARASYRQTRGMAMVVRFGGPSGRHFGASGVLGIAGNAKHCHVAVE